MLNIIQQCKNPSFIIITPLKTGDNINKETRKMVKRNDVPFDWVSYENDYNIPTNTTFGLSSYTEQIRTPPNYIIKLDNDIFPDRGLLDEMYNVLSRSGESIAYTYCPFQYILPDGRRIGFDKEFSSEILKSNFISSNSMIRLDKLLEVGGFVTDSKYERLLDWCLWLRFYRYGYIGKKVSKAFTTPLNPDNVSARGQKDYSEKYNRVLNDFVYPIKKSGE